MPERDRFQYDLEPLVALFPIEGLNTWESKFTLKPAMLTDLSNVDWTRTKDAVSSAKGRDAFASGLPSPNLGLGRFTSAVSSPPADRSVFVGTAAGAPVFRVIDDAGVIATPTVVSGTPVPVNAVNRWNFASYSQRNNNTIKAILGACNGVDTPLKIVQDSFTTISQVGIVKPTGTPTIAVGAAGNLNGGYQWRVTFQSTTHESSPGPVSAKLTLVNQQASLTAIPVSADGQVTARNIYRIGGLQSEWLFVATINDNTTTAFTDNVADVNLLTLLAFNRDPPPAAIRGWIEHKQRWFGFVANNLYFSNFQEPEGWNASNVFPVGGSSNLQAIGTTGSVLLIFKDAQVFGLLGESLADFILVPVFRKGTISGPSVVSAEGLVFWLADDGIRYSDGRETKLVGLELKGKLDAVSLANRRLTVGVYGSNRVMFSIPNAFTVALDMITMRWEVYPWIYDFAISAHDEAGLDAFLVTDTALAGAIRTWPGIGYTDLGTNISWFIERDRVDTVRRGEYHLGPRHYFQERSTKSVKRFRDAEIIAPPQAGVLVTLTITIDGDTVNKIYTKVVDLTAGDVRIGLPPRMVGSLAKVRVSGTNGVVVEIAGVVLWGYLERPYSKN